jgi:mercuric ion binding protein
MKNMKILFVIAFALTITTITNAQKYNSKLDGPFTVSKTFKVSGICDMCERRIENSIKQLQGVWSSHWDLDSHTLQVTYDRLKLNPEKIQRRLAAAGHDTENFKAGDDVYSKLPECCHYQRKS